MTRSDTESAATTADSAEIHYEGQVASVVVGGMEQTRIDTSRPDRLEFEYMQQMDVVLKMTFAEPTPIRAAHIGGCGCALAWAWDLARPGSRQLAVEVDPQIAEQARKWFPLPRKPQLRIRTGDGRRVLEGSKATHDVIVRDAFAGAEVPAHLQTTEWASVVSERLTAQGLYLANAGHGGGKSCRADVAAALQIFPDLRIIGPSKVLKGARQGNIVIAACASGALDNEELDRRLRRLPLPVSLLMGADLSRWLGGAPPARDHSSWASQG